jgi:putative toxin-antitoxin system antitoxin component (TIGR02293 family)
MIGVLGGHQVINTDVQSSFDWILISEKGLPILSLQSVQKHLNFSNRQMGLLVNMSESTFQRRVKLQATLSKDETERTIQLSALIAKGLAVFEDNEDFQRWLNTPNLSLGGRVPNQLLGSAIGLELLHEVLIRIEHGIYA